MLSHLIHSIAADVTQVIVIDNASQPYVSPLSLSYWPHNLRVIYNDEQPPNLSRLWNIGINAAEQHVYSADHTDHMMWNVALLNDDTVLPSGWYAAVSTALREHPTAAVACGALSHHVQEPILKNAPDSDLLTRMTPWAFIMRGEIGIRGDETLRWWWGDTDVDWQARQAGGVLIIPGNIAENTCANSSTNGVLLEQAGRDRETFRQKWGGNPW